MSDVGYMKNANKILVLGILMVFVAGTFTSIVQASNEKYESMATTITEYPLQSPNENPYGIVINSNGTIFFTEFNTARIGKMNESGSVVYYNLVGSAEPRNICINDNGTIFFTTKISNKIGKMTESGSFTYYTVPRECSSPEDIFVNSNGTIYFTEESGNQIGKMTEAGSFTEYSIPTPACHPIGICAYEDDGICTIYFCEAFAGHIGKMTESGSFTEYDIPAGAFAAPVDIAVNENGTVFFTENYINNHIGKMTPAGSFTEYDVASNSYCNQITINTDGVIYYTEYDFISDNVYPEKVGRITESGSYTEYTMVHRAFTTSRGITHNANGTIFFCAGTGEGGGYDYIDKLSGDNIEPPVPVEEIDIVIINPAGGEEWEVGSVQDINWTTTGGIGDLLINISYAIEGESPFTNITNDEENDGGYEWTIPNTPSGTVWLLVTAYDEEGNDNASFSFSEMFAIIAVEEPPVTEEGITIQVTHPSTSYIGNAITIHADVSIDSLTDEISSVIIYYRYSGQAYRTVSMELTSGNTDDGTWSGTIPETTELGTLEFYVKATSDEGSKASTTVYDIEITEEIPTTTPLTISIDDLTFALIVFAISIALIWLAWAFKPAILLIIVGAIVIIIYILVM